MALSRHPLTPAAQQLGHIPLDRATVTLLASSFRTVQARGAEFADRFYDDLFRAHPKVRSMFPADMTAQKAKLLDTLGAVIDHLTDPTGNLHRIQELGRRHKGYGVRPEHFPPVVEAMLGAMQAVAGSEWSSAVRDEWRRALMLVAEVMIKAAAEAKD